MDESTSGVLRFLFDNKPKVLNIAGPRESKAPGIQEATKRFVGAILDVLKRYAGLLSIPGD